MAIDKLSVYNNALILIGERTLTALTENREPRRLLDSSFDFDAINYCLEEAFVEPSELDTVVFYDNPLLSFDRVFKSILSVEPRGHVSQDAFGQIDSTAEQAGLSVRDRPKVRFSRAAVFVKAAAKERTQ